MFPDDHSTPEQVDRRVRAWLQRFVVGLNLCPFARPVVSSEALRVVVCEATEHQDITAVFMTELDLIQRSPESMVAQEARQDQEAGPNQNTRQVGRPVHLLPLRQGGPEPPAAPMLAVRDRLLL